MDQKDTTAGKPNSLTYNMQLLKIHKFAILIIIVIACRRNGKTISGINIPLTQPYRSIIAALKTQRCPNDQKRNYHQNKKMIEPLTIESSAYIRSPDKHIFLSKRSFACLMQCLRVGNLHPAQCHSLCFN